jgi:restriction system protein
MPKEISRTKAVGMKTIYAALDALKSAGGSMNITDLLDAIRKSVHFDEWEQGRYEKTGYVRWESIFHFYSIDCTKAGFIQKNKGTWIITPEGEAALKLGPEGLLKSAVQGYSSWKQNQKPDEDTTLVDEKGSVEETLEQSQQALIVQFEEKAYAGLRDFVLRKNPYDFQKMVATLLSAMGYYIFGKRAWCVY